MTVLAILVLFAPAPFLRPAPPGPPAIREGLYVMAWRGVEARTRFQLLQGIGGRNEGWYDCRWQGRDWTGRYTCDGGTLSVIEWPCDDPSSQTKWSVQLSSPVAGVLDGGSEWKLSPWKCETERVD